MSKAKTQDELKMMESVSGVWLSFIGLLTAAVRKGGGAFVDIRRLTTPEGKKDLAAIVAIINRAKSAAADLFRATVAYIQPSFAELNSAFDWVKDDYKRIRFEAIASCKDISRNTREIAFQYVHMNRDASTETVLAEMDKLGLRPALSTRNCWPSPRHTLTSRENTLLLLSVPSGWSWMATALWPASTSTLAGAV